MTFRVGVIGHPVAHSISPRFQQAGFDAAGIDAVYDAWDLQPSELEGFIDGLRSSHSLGANVTIPYKEAALRHMDGLHETARFVGAINTVVNQSGHLQGYNTDVSGFQRSLLESGFDPAGAQAVLWGAGGAARAVAWALIWRGVDGITIVNRTAVRAGRLRHDLASASAGVSLRAMGSDDEQVDGALQQADLVVQCTSVGLRGSETDGQLPFDPGRLAPDAFVADLIANPVKTALVRAVEASGRRSIGGLPMLVYQGTAAFELWTEQAAPVDVMLREAETAMAEVSDE